MRWYKILYVMFIGITILYGSVTIAGPISLRHVISAAMLLISLIEGYRMDKYMLMYLVFLFFLGLSSVVTGFGGTFFERLLGTYVPIIAAYSATYILIKKHDGANVLIWLFVGLAVFDAFVTIGQFYSWGRNDRLLSLLRISTDEAFLDRSFGKDSLMGLTLSGLFGPVLNGYFLSASALVVLCNKKGNAIINAALWALVMFASYLAQERAGFYLAILFSLFIMGRQLYGKSRFLFYVCSFVALFCLILFSNRFGLLFTGDSRYAKGLDIQDRGELWSYAWNYFLQNPMGGFYDYESRGYGSPHFFPLNALLFGGVFGGITIMVLLIMQIVKIMPYLLKRKNSMNAEWAFVFGLAYLDFSCNSLVHNASMIQGTFLFFVWWGAFLAFADKEEKPLLLGQQ